MDSRPCADLRQALEEIRALRKGAGGGGAEVLVRAEGILARVARLVEAEESRLEAEGRMRGELRALCSGAALSDLLEMTMDAAVRLTGAERGFVLFAGMDGALEMAASRGMDRAAAKPRDGEVSRNIARSVMDTGRTVCLNDAQSSPFNGAESVARLKLRSVLAAPVRASGRVVGVLYLENRGLTGVFDAQRRRLVEEFCESLGQALCNAQTMGELRRARDEMACALAQQERFPGFVGRSEVFHRALADAIKAAASDLPVVVEGESGTGKDLLARAIHAASRRAAGPLVAVNCAALPAQLLESELFGHVRGAFTGTERERKGLFASADRGTLFLDEVGEMPLGVQAKLLRALQSGEYRPVGSDDPLRSSVRVVAATSKRLTEEVAAGRFREDLYYRLSAVSLRAPALRERREDILPLAEYFLRNESGGVARLSPEARIALAAYDYPGNVRELENIIRRALVFADNGEVTLASLPAAVAASKPPAEASGPPRTGKELAEAKRQARDDAAARLEKAFVVEALRLAGGNASQAARSSGMNRSQFQQIMKRCGVRAGRASS